MKNVNTYIVLENGEKIRGKEKFEDETSIVLNDILILKDMSKIGTKRITKEAISKKFYAISKKIDDEKNIDRIDYSKTEDRRRCFNKEIEEIVSTFLGSNFSFKDEEDLSLILMGLLNIIKKSKIIKRILKGKR